MRRALLCCLLLASCADSADEADDGIDETDVDEPEDLSLQGLDPADDVDLVPVLDDAPPVTDLALLPTQVVYVNFSGPIIYECSSGYCNDAVNRRHHYIRDTFGRHSLDFSSWGTSAQRATVVDFLKSRFSKYRVSFTTTKPTSGEYTMLVISSSAVGPTSLRGKADTDCHATADGQGAFNTIRRDIAFVVRVGGVSSSWVKRYAAHELAHTFGLLHVVSSSDLMHYKSYGYSFTSGSSYDNAHNPAGYRCVAGGTQNEPALLTKALGLK